MTIASIAFGLGVVALLGNAWLERRINRLQRRIDALAKEPTDGK